MLQDFIGVCTTMHLVHQVLQLLLIMNLVYTSTCSIQVYVYTSTCSTGKMTVKDGINGIPSLFASGLVDGAMTDYQKRGVRNLPVDGPAV